MGFGLEAAEKTDDERVVGKRHDVTLRENLIHLVSQDYVSFAHLLHKLFHR